MASPYRRPLLVTEHSEFDAGAETLALTLARQWQVPLHAVLPLVSNAEFEMLAPQQAARADAEALGKRRSLQAQALALGVPLALEVRHGPDRALEALDEAQRFAADLIVVRRRGQQGFLANLLVGEMVSQLIALSPCSVLVVPRGASMWTRRVLVGIDAQAPHGGVLDAAAALAAASGLGLQVVGVAAGAGEQASAERALSDAVQIARQRCADVRGELRSGPPQKELMAAARDCAADLLVLARRHGADPAGSGTAPVAHHVVGQAECPVLLHVRPPQCENLEP